MMRLRFFLPAARRLCYVAWSVIRALALTVALSGFSTIFADTGASYDEDRYENIDALRDQITRYANQQFRSIYGEEKFKRDVRVRISQLDPRLKLKHCDKSIRFEVVRPVHQSRNVTIKTLCDGDHRWSIFVPATLEVYANVVVAARNLERGTVIGEEDITLTRINTSTLPGGHILDKDRVVGMELRRSTRSGSYLVLSALELPRVISKGDAVVLEAGSTALTVAAKGTALANGQVGEQIKVRNDQSERVIDALVVGPGRVSVVSR